MTDPVQLRATEPEDRLVTASGSVEALAAWTGSDGHTMLASGGRDGMIRRWDATAGTPLGKPLTGGGSVTALTAWTGPDGQTILASAASDRVIRVWDATAGALIGNPLTGAGAVRALAAWTGPDGQTMLASGSDDGMIRRWDATAGTPLGNPLASGRKRARWRGRSASVRVSDWVWALAAWTGPDGQTILASAAGDGVIRVWDATAGALIGNPLTGAGAVLALAAWTGSDGHTMLASTGYDGMIRRWDATAGTPLGNPLTGHTRSVTALIAWTGPDSQTILASAGEDGTIRRWDATAGTPLGNPLTGHISPVQALTAWTGSDGHTMLASTSDGWSIQRWDAMGGSPLGNPLTGTGSVRALIAWTGPDGQTMLANAGYDGMIRRWDATAGTPLGNPLTGGGSVTALAAWTGPDGQTMLASGSDDGMIRRWDATAGTPLGKPLTSGRERTRRRRWPARWRGRSASVRVSDWVRALAAWTGPDGQTILASAAGDGVIRVWDATAGALIGNPLTGAGAVTALAAWTGQTMLASGSDDGMIRRWDATAGTPLGEPLTGHTSSVTALIAWTGPDGHTSLASASDDGTIRVWDASTGRLLQRVFVEPIRLRGLADRPAVHDLLGREALTQVLANLLLWRPTEAGGETGPSVVAFEGPWGAGKTTVLRLVEARIAAKPENRGASGYLSVATARKILGQGNLAGAAESATKTPPHYRGALTAWFNPWIHQSSDQVWAGLARSITDAARIVLYPDDDEAEAHRYWLKRNAERIDRFSVRKRLLLRTLSPILGFSAVTALATILINLAKLNNNVLFHIVRWRVTPSGLALAVAAVLLLVGLVHTVIRYYGRASRFLPADLIRGPVLSGSLGEGAADIVQNLRDPVYWLKSGYLHLIQQDTATTIRDLRSAGYDLVVFIDDLDRCSARTTAEVFEAINLFLSGTTDLNAKFVIGLDPAVVAADLDTVYKDLDVRYLLQYGDDPSPGWAFLRKVVQLPVGAPHITDPAIQRFVAAGLDVPVEMIHSATNAIHANPGIKTDKVAVGPVQSLPAGYDELTTAPQAPGRDIPRMGSLERQPEILDLISQRLAAQPERSAREAKRLLNVWQLYQRVLDLVAPLRDDEAVVARACHLVILAEIVTRWPALQRQLHQSWNGRRGLQILAASCHDDANWKSALTITGLDTEEHARALANLRELLCTCDGATVATLAAQVL
jgi:WD40 repeat protein